MALVSSVLGSGLAAMVPTPTEATAIAAFVSAWDAYFAGASVLGIPATPGTYAAGLSAMQGAMTGMSAPGGAAAAIQAGVQAFWGAILAQGAVIFVMVPPSGVIPPLVPPPGISGIAAALTGVFASNTSGMVPLPTAADNVASAIHPAGGLGGTAPVQTPPAPPVPTPIL